ncbi:hypothetical protein PG993_009116 [Apiospora rasikravindrae]|uniref:C2H2-type domain-containing protein n=1 Tax=Apiospora rasikravindrae TaxID=990691 RepID=A0ABR1SIG1_9PEZI
MQELAPKIDDEHSRFQLYVKNSGATRTGRSSLQYRLREASGIRTQVVSSLQILAEFLDDALAATTDMEDREDGIVEPDDIDELDDLVCDIERIITSLLRLLVAIRNPAPHDRFSLSVAETDTSYFHPRDIAHVHDKFPAASSALCERLGKANSYRRQYFKYREARHIRLEQGKSLEDGGRSEVASSIPPELKDGANPAHDSGFIDEDYQSEGYSRRHILRDLQCYVCLHDDCPGVTQQFESLHDWIQHMRQQHWRLWHCPVGCAAPFATWTQFATHMAASHGEKVVPTSTASRPRPSWIEEPCPLCNERMRSARQYQSHVGEHHMDLALFALPNAEYPTFEPRGGQVQHQEQQTQRKQHKEPKQRKQKKQQHHPTGPGDPDRSASSEDIEPWTYSSISSYNLRQDVLEQWLKSRFSIPQVEIQVRNYIILRSPKLRLSQTGGDGFIVHIPREFTPPELKSIEKLRRRPGY